MACAGPLHVHLPFYDHDRYRSYHESHGRSSTDSGSTSTSRSSSPASVENTSPLSSRSNSVRSTNGRSTRSPESFDKVDSRLPQLRIAFSAPSSNLETIPASPPASSAPPSVCSSVDEGGDTRYTLRPSPTPSPRDSFISPSFTIPSANSIRRQKMDRLRRKLGDGVPLDLVFPRENEEVNGEAKKEKELPAAPPTPRNSPAARISYTRDSMSMVSPSPHRARRRKVPVTLKASRPAPPPPEPHQRKQKKQEKLCAIIESPDEHGSGCSEEFGVKRVGSESPRTSSESAVSEWYFSDGESASEVNVWSTRKGYTGWEEHARAYEGRRRSWNSRKVLNTVNC